MLEQDITNSLSYLDTIISLLALVIALVAAIFARGSSKSAKLTAKLAEQTLYQSKLVTLQSYPSIDFVEIVDEDTDSPKLKFMIYNVYDRPIKLESLQVYVYDSKPRTLLNLYKRYTEGLDLDFRLAEGVHWNPIGNLEPKLYFKKDAAKFRVVKDQESILVFVREITSYKHKHLKVIVRTNISEQTLKFDTYGSKLLFEVNGNIQYHIKRLG